jgi:uncharacterized protein (TIGR03066 family)
MKVVRTLLVLSLALTLSGAAAAQKKPPKETKKESAKLDAAKLVGTWEVSFDSGNLGKGATFAFSKDGKVTVKYTANGNETTIEADYSVDGDVIKITSKKPDIKETRTVTAFSAKEMETDNSTGGHTKYTKK